MAVNLLSPGVDFTENNYTTVPPAVSSSNGAYAGVFAWGPVLDPVTISREAILVERFGKPNNSNFQSFFTAANFLAYTNSLLLVRADTTNARNSVSTPTGSVTSLIVNSGGSGYMTTPSISISAPDLVDGLQAEGEAVLSGGAVDTISIDIKGTGYTSASVAFSAPAIGDTAIGTVVLSGSVTGMTIVAAGSGYSSATVTFSAPEIFGGVTATGTVALSGNVVDSITVTNPGSGYLAAPVATISGNGSNAIATSILTFSSVESISVSNAGSGYLSPPVLTITGTGSNASASATITSSIVSSILVTNPGAGYTSTPTVSITGGGGNGATATSTVVAGGVKIKNSDDYVSNYVNGAGVVGEFAAKYPGSLGNSLKVSMADSSSFASWAYKGEFETVPGTSIFADGINGHNDEMHIVVVDEDGLWTGTKNTILERYRYVSKASGAKKPEGTNNYYKDVINTTSRYIWWMDHPTTVSNWGGSAENKTFENLTAGYTVSLTGGVDDYAVTDGQLMQAFDIFANEEMYDISLLPVGKASPTVALHVINNVAEVRRDCLAFISPQNISTGEIIIGSGSDGANAINAYRNTLPSSSYFVIDTGYKYQYDKYNDKFRYIPLNADIAGLCARTDFTNDPWDSPGGYNRGQIKNVIKLAYNPGKTERNTLYVNGVNSVVSFPGEGPILYGDKTGLARPSVFNRINVRRLFIVLEKAISKAAKYSLFENNNSFTQAQFKNLVEPFLRDVQGKGGIAEGFVICDSTNNTPEVMANNQFVGDIFIRPNFSINFIQLNFTPISGGANFTVTGA